MASISAFDAKTRFGELLKRVARGEEIVITRHDKPVARIVPEDGFRGEQGRRALSCSRRSADAPRKNRLPMQRFGRRSRRAAADP